MRVCNSVVAVVHLLTRLPYRVLGYCTHHVKCLCALDTRRSGAECGGLRNERTNEPRHTQKAFIIAMDNDALCACAAHSLPVLAARTYVTMITFIPRSLNKRRRQRGRMNARARVRFFRILMLKRISVSPLNLPNFR